MFAKSFDLWSYLIVTKLFFPLESLFTKPLTSAEDLLLIFINLIYFYSFYDKLVSIL